MAKTKRSAPDGDAEFGVVGMGTMGQNLALNVASRGFKVSAWNRADEFAERVWKALERGKQEGGLDGSKMQIDGFSELGAFVTSLKLPRRILLSIPAGAAVDGMLEQLKPLLTAGDVVIDGGNEEFKNTERRAKALLKEGIHFVGMGISGGEVGARNGPALMPGGTAEGYAAVRPILEAMAARSESDGVPCVCHVGPGGSGHYVKMVHNGIEYADMQLIAEAYDLLRRAYGLSCVEIAEAFELWNGPESRLRCYLLEITAQCLRKEDDLQCNVPLVDRILDQAGSKGTGKWTVQNAADAGVAVPAISAALEGRFVSSRKAERSALEALYAPLLKKKRAPLKEDATVVLEQLEAALYGAKVCAYAQGFSLIAAASEEYGWNVNTRDVARLWRGGCIIRAALLEDIATAFQKQPKMQNLLADPTLATAVAGCTDGLREVVVAGVRASVALPAFSSSLAYFDGITTKRGPANIIQAQRDFFGAHTYKRTDQAGSFHCTSWDTSDCDPTYENNL